MNYNLYEYALTVTKSKVMDTCRELQTEYGNNVISNIELRIKTEESIREKLDRNGLSYSDDNIVEYIKDIAGLRLVCPHLSDIYLLTEKLTALDGMTVVEIKDYIKNPKPNGYRSLHIIMSIPVNLCGQLLFIPVEIQLRTIYMNVWAKIEHKLCYKSKRKPFHWLKKRLRAYSEYIAKIELSYAGNSKHETLKMKRFKRIAHVMGV